MEYRHLSERAADRPRSVLIVDADPDSRLLYRIVFSNLAAAIGEAEDGAEALGKAICSQPDLVVTDTRLSRIDGYQLCALLRHDKSTHATGIVVVTAAASPEDVDRALTAGADEVLIKPCLPDEVMAAAYRTWWRRSERRVTHA